jgi:hypothetical protein
MYLSFYSSDCGGHMTGWLTLLFLLQVLLTSLNSFNQMLLKFDRSLKLDHNKVTTRAKRMVDVLSEEVKKISGSK